MSDKYVMTKDGLEELKKELEARKEKLKEIADKIDEARQQGDLSENAAYTMALAEKELNESKISEIEDQITGAVVVEANKGNSKVDIGEKVVLKKLSDNSKITYEVVGPSESDPTTGKISVDSPIGKALANKKKGDKIVVSLPAGEETYEIDEIL